MRNKKLMKIKGKYFDYWENGLSNYHAYQSTVNFPLKIF